MSSFDVNDENHGVFPPPGKHSGTIDDIFALDQPTGRPSILRQTENLPNKSVTKGIKVQLTVWFVCPVLSFFHYAKTVGLNLLLNAGYMNCEHHKFKLTLYHF